MNSSRCVKQIEMIVELGKMVYGRTRRLDEKNVQELRREAGLWLKELREKRGLSQRELADKLGIKYYTFISQLETGRGRVPPDQYSNWSEALGIDNRIFVQTLLSFYDPITYKALF